MINHSICYCKKNHFKNILSWSKYCHDIVWWGVWWFPLLLNSVVEVKLPLHFGHANNISLVDEGRVKEIFFFLQDAVHLTHFTGKKNTFALICVVSHAVARPVCTEDAIFESQLSETQWDHSVLSLALPCLKAWFDFTGDLTINLFLKAFHTECTLNGKLRQKTVKNLSGQVREHYT